MGRFTLQFLIYPKYYYFGIMIGNFTEVDAYGIGLGIGAGLILLGIKK